MKRHEITNNELELIFNTIIEQTPLISENEVITLLNNPPKAPATNSFRNFFKAHLNALIIGAVILCVVPISIFLFTENEVKTETTDLKETVQENKPGPTRENALLVHPQSMKPDSANKKNAMNPVPANKSPKIVKPGPEISVADVCKHFEKKPQLFSIRPDRDTVVVCREGTAIRIKAKSFVSEKTGEEVSGKVQLAVKEYYKLSDILLARLSTTSEGKIIETGGMLHLSATSDNEACVIKQGEKLEIGFPCEEKKDDMILFTGELKNDQINWKPAENSTPENSDKQENLIVSVERTEEPVFVVVEEMPEFPGGTIGLRTYLEKNTHYPYSALKDKLEGKVYVNFVIDRLGYVRNMKIARGLGNILDKAAVYAISQLPATWKPGKQRGQPLSVSYTVPVTFRINDSDLTDEEIRQAKLFEKQLAEFKYNDERKKFTEEFEQKVKDGKLQESDIFAANRYILGANQLGWINCDRFVNFTNPKTNFSVLLDEPRNTVVSVIFHRVKAILTGQIENDRISFKDVPVGEKITIVALKTVKDKILLAVKETTIADQMEVNLEFQEITIDLLKSELEKLNQLD